MHGVAVLSVPVLVPLLVILTVAAGVRGAVAPVGKSGRVNTVESGINCCTTPMNFIGMVLGSVLITISGC